MKVPLSSLIEDNDYGGLLRIIIKETKYVQTPTNYMSQVF